MEVVMRMSFARCLSAAFVVGLIAGLSATARTQELKVCKSTFALCTIAPCDPVPGSDKQVSCHCTVNHGYSVGGEPCFGVKDTADGQEIHSRYYPVKSYAICSND